MQTSTVGNSNDRNNNNPQSQVDTNSKCVINLSKTRLSKGQISVLTNGPNFAIAPRHIPNMDYNTAVELVCHKLEEQDTGELRADINSLLRRAKVPRSNLTKQESIGLNQLIGQGQGSTYGQQESDNGSHGWEWLYQKGRVTPCTASLQDHR